MCLAVSLELAPGLPQRAEPVFVGDGVLDDERVESPRMCDCEPESHRTAVVLHDQGVAAQAEDLGETADDSGQVVEGVGKLGRAGRIAVPEPGIVRCNQAELADGPVQQRLLSPFTRRTADILMP